MFPWPFGKFGDLLNVPLAPKIIVINRDLDSPIYRQDVFSCIKYVFACSVYDAVVTIILNDDTISCLV